MRASAASARAASFSIRSVGHCHYVHGAPPHFSSSASTGLSSMTVSGRGARASRSASSHAQWSSHPSKENAWRALSALARSSDGWSCSRARCPSGRRADGAVLSEPDVQSRACRALFGLQQTTVSVQSGQPLPVGPALILVRTFIDGLLKARRLFREAPSMGVSRFIGLEGKAELARDWRRKSAVVSAREQCGGASLKSEAPY
jgi:hypothetical protein